MRILLLIPMFFFIPALTCVAQERIKMTQESGGERDATELLEKIADCASSGDFKGFLDCFTKKYASGLRRKMKRLFETCEIDMRILESRVESKQEDSMKIKLKYEWDDGFSEKIIFSEVKANLESGSWKIASESVLEVKEKSERTPHFEADFGGGGQVTFNVKDEMLPLDMPRLKGGCANGRCGVAQPRPQFQAPNNMNFGRVDLGDILPADMPRLRGGCANGQCGIGR